MFGKFFWVDKLKCNIVFVVVFFFDNGVGENRGWCVLVLSICEVGNLLRWDFLVSEVF